ncbi:hypothetical protein KP77_08460 [Jeotgalibacillus alimentarius]|uniref:Uncharacterized protein n=1 Tax=Jeotgalibacillus alimentarius TaxID=135826 RepID=A0A0C2SBJ3_9BACL|nr:hypothetical protein KP77_08460 [Jeotgalibacillus alimentarius]
MTGETPQTRSVEEGRLNRSQKDGSCGKRSPCSGNQQPPLTEL